MMHLSVAVTLIVLSLEKLLKHIYCDIVFVVFFCNAFLKKILYIGIAVSVRLSQIFYVAITLPFLKISLLNFYILLLMTSWTCCQNV